MKGRRRVRGWRDIYSHPSSTSLFLRQDVSSRRRIFMLRKILASLLLTSTISLNAIARAGDENQVSLTGIVRSQAEGPMEGVLVSAKAVGGTVTTTVVTDSQGRYVFPR